VFGVALYKGFDERGFANLQNILGYVGSLHARTYTRGPHDGNNNGRCLLREAVDQRNMEPLLFDLGLVRAELVTQVSQDIHRESVPLASVAVRDLRTQRL